MGNIDIKNLRNYIDAELSLSQIMFMIIIAKLYGGWVVWVCAVSIVGNVLTFAKNVKKLPRNYTE